MNALIRTLKHRTWSAAMLVLSIWGMPELSAQGDMELDYLIRFSSQVTEAHEKHIHEALQGHEPGAGVWVDRPNSQVIVRTFSELDRAALESAWVPVGIMIASMGRLGESLEMERSSETMDDPFPVFYHTGDPAVDQANYDAAKAAWISAHPAAYARMLNDGSSASPTTDR